MAIFRGSQEPPSPDPEPVPRKVRDYPKHIVCKCGAVSLRHCPKSTRCSWYACRKCHFCTEIRDGGEKWVIHRRVDWRDLSE